MTLRDLADITKGRFIYLASPYTLYRPGIEEACREISVVAGRLMEEGITVFCPIAHSHMISTHARIDPNIADFWLRLDRPLADAAFGLVVADMDGWVYSKGVKEEIQWFMKALKPMWLLNHDTFTLTYMLPLTGA